MYACTIHDFFVQYRILIIIVRDNLVSGCNNPLLRFQLHLAAMFNNPYICLRSRILSTNQDNPFKCMRSQCSVSDNDNRYTSTIR